MVVKRACVRVLDRPPYHGLQVKNVLSRMGYEICPGISNPTERDVFVIWNRYSNVEPVAQSIERAGGAVIVMENGYFGRTFDGGPWYALSIGQHNGGGRLPQPDLGKWGRIDYPERRWQSNPDGPIVVLATRNMGSGMQREPNGWSDKMAEGLQSEYRDKAVRVRKHPGRQGIEPDSKLEDDIFGAYACVTWGSSAGLKAIMFGIPVFHGLRNWIGAAAARRIGDMKFGPYVGPREPLKARLATAMWTLAEIESGEAIECVLSSR